MQSKIYLMLVLFIASCFKLSSQNLAPNYSFEDTTMCPAIYAEFGGYVTKWAGGFPAYFSPYCSDSPAGGMPKNDIGYQYPHSGHAYAGIYTFIDSAYDSFYANLRDYLQDSLISPLKAGIKYYVTFYVNLADSEKYACNSIGAYFSDSALAYHPSRRVKSFLTPQIENDTANHLTDKINWMKVSGSFIAAGGEKYIIIGNFKDDAHSDTVFVNSPAHKENIWTNAYYFIDDVIVTTDSNYADSLFPTSVQNLNRPIEYIRVFPNPSNGMFTIAVESEKLKVESTVEVYNMLGQKVYAAPLNPPIRGTSSTTISLPNGEGRGGAGIYLYRITSPDRELVSQGKLVIE